MSDNAIFGRYWPSDSPIHRLDPRTKVLGTLFLVIIIFSSANVASLAFSAAFLFALVVASRIPISQAFRSVAPLAFIVLLTALFNLLFVQGGEVYVDFGWVRISQDGIAQAAFIAVRLFLLLLSGSLLTLTTTTMDITEAIERLLAPLGRIGAPTHEFAFVMGTAIRFLPQFQDELHHIRMAQVARGARLSTSPMRNGASAFASLVVPLFASVFRHAETLSDAMEARCYHGAAGRTRLHPLKFARRDALAAIALVAAFGAIILLNVVV